MKEKVLASYAIGCIGAPPSGVELDPKISTVTATITVYESGSREVGCPFLRGGVCGKFGKTSEGSLCRHLYPEKS